MPMATSITLFNWSLNGVLLRDLDGDLVAGLLRHLLAALLWDLKRKDVIVQIDKTPFTVCPETGIFAKTI